MISAGFKFTDIFFNNIFTDLAVGHQIRDAQNNVDQSVQQVNALKDRLRDQSGTVTKQPDLLVQLRKAVR